MPFEFKASGYSDNGLLMMHEGITKAHAADVAAQGKVKPFGVYEYADWKIQADEIEQELTDRKITFAPIPWQVD